MAGLLKPEDLRKISDDIEMEKAKKALAHRKDEEDEQSKLREAFMSRDLHAEVHTFIGRWIDLPPGCECRVGASRATGCLGVNNSTQSGDRSGFWMHVHWKLPSTGGRPAGGWFLAVRSRPLACQKKDWIAARYSTLGFPWKL